MRPLDTKKRTKRDAVDVYVRVYVCAGTCAWTYDIYDNVIFMETIKMAINQRRLVEPRVWPLFMAFWVSTSYGRDKALVRFEGVRSE